MTLQGISAAVLTVSDRCSSGERQDLSGPLLAQILRENGISLLPGLIVPDEVEPISSALRSLAQQQAALILTTGGTGLSPRDITPEATLAVAQRLVPGLAELIREQGRAETPFASLGRGVAVTLGSSLIVNLPGSPRGAENGLRCLLPLLPHALALLAGGRVHA